jgi:hypothetical protein
LLLGFCGSKGLDQLALSSPLPTPGFPAKLSVLNKPRSPLQRVDYTRVDNPIIDLIALSPSLDDSSVGKTFELIRPWVIFLIGPKKRRWHAPCCSRGTDKTSDFTTERGKAVSENERRVFRTERRDNALTLVLLGFRVETQR